MQVWRPRLLRVVPAMGAAFMLQGCLVAALPVVAGGALATRDAVKESRQDAAPAAPSGEVSVAAQPETPSGTPETPGEEGWRVSQLTELPAPSGSGLGALGAGADDARAYSGFAAYALAQADGSQERQSALLVNPGALDGQRKPCGDTPPAVLIDLDPWSGLVDVDGNTANKPELAAQLEQLRRQDVTIGWISGRLAIDAERIRARLAQSGLDPLGEDTLLLMQSLDQSKQRKRASFGRDYCLVAIAGDIDSDFDELFDYIKNQDMALRLSPLRNAGWFITPLPLTTMPLATAPLTEE